MVFGVLDQDGVGRGAKRAERSILVVIESHRARAGPVDHPVARSVSALPTGQRGDLEHHRDARRAPPNTPAGVPARPARVVSAASPLSALSLRFIY